MMEAKKLFLERCVQVLALSRPRKEVELLDLSALLRKLIADKKPLVDTVNMNKIKIRFTVAGAKPPWADNPGIKGADWFLMEGMDPTYVDNPNIPILSLDRSQFLAFPCIYNGPTKVTVKDVVRYAANAAGGVHHDPKPKPEYAVIDALAKQENIHGLPAGLHQLSPIARITLRGLAPLVEDVKKRLDEGRP